MRRIATCLRNERPEPVEATGTLLLDDGPWGFHAIDGLPDLEAAPPYRQAPRDHDGRLLLSDGSVADGLDDVLKEELTRIQRCAREIQMGRGAGHPCSGRRNLTTYEREVAGAMTARRDAVIRLQQILADDVAQFEVGMDCIQAGLVMDLMVPHVSGTARRTMSDVVSDFESTRHRFRLALVAVAIDNGMSAAQIGQAFAFSRQLASRYLKEARDKWPELAEQFPARATVG
jgi:hypothetical protein